MKKVIDGVYKLTVYSNNKEILEQLHGFMVNDGEQSILITKDDKLFYPNIDWNIKNRKDLDLSINCNFDCEAD